MCIHNNRRRRSLIEAEAALAFSSNMEGDYSDSEATSVSPDEMLTGKEHHTAQSNKQKKKREIQHNYHDHANNDGAMYLNAPVVSKGGVTVPFPEKLHNMLEHIDKQEPELDSIVSWQPHGRCFLVKDIKAFTADVLPRFFQQKKYASFQRQLNLYGFSRLTKGTDRGSYYHELFLRSKRILCRGIQRMKVKGTGSRMASNPTQEPNFYSMQSMPSLRSNEVVHELAEPQKISPVRSSAFSTVSPAMNYQLNTFPKRVSLTSSSLPRVNQKDHIKESYPQKVKKEEDDEKKKCRIDENSAFYVFDNMKFHELGSTGSSRRHSLTDTTHRISQLSNAKRRDSIGLVDDDFDRDMEMICQLGDFELSDQNMSYILDKIVDQQMF